MDKRIPTPLPPATGRIALFIPTFGDGGVEHMLVNLARGFSARGAAVDFLIKDRNAPYLSSLNDAVNVIELTGHQPAQLLTSLERYLDQARPEVLMSGKIRDDKLVIAAKRRYQARRQPGPRVFVRIGTTVSARLEKRRRNSVKRWLARHTLRRLCRAADGVICVSQGVADDVRRIVGLPPPPLHVLRNPVVLPELARLAAAAVDHPWFVPGQPPVVLGAGGLRRQKNFSLLLHAFAHVNAHYPCRLMIIGEGRQRARLQQLAGQLGIADSVDFPGFVANPYAYMAKASLFTLSSDWEGSPNVLVEAMAVGTPVVATDCPSGPREILQGGRFGALVPVGDVNALAGAMRQSLTDIVSGVDQRARLRQAVAGYTLERSSVAYLNAFGFEVTA